MLVMGLALLARRSCCRLMCRRQWVLDVGGFWSEDCVEELLRSELLEEEERMWVDGR